MKIKKIGIIIITTIILLVGTTVKAEEINYNYKQYRLQYHMGTNDTWIGPYDFGTSTNTTSYDYIKAFAGRFGYTTKYTANKKYRITMEVGYSPINSAISNGYTSLTQENISCYGSSTSSWSANASLIDECEYIGATRVGTTNHIRYIIDVVPNASIYGIQINVSLPTLPPYGINSFNIYNASTVKTGEDITGAIDQQTIIIQNEIDDIEQIIIQNNEELINAIDQDHEYTTETIDDKVNQYENQQEQINNNINLTTDNGQLTIWWGASAMSMIWNLVAILIAPITIYYTSYLALGIIRLILGR